MRRLPLILALGAVVSACVLVAPLGASAAATTPTTTTISSVSSLNPVAGADVKFTVSVTSGGAALSGASVAIIDANGYTWATGTTGTDGTATVTVSGLPQGTVIVHAEYSGSKTYQLSDSSSVTINVGGNALPRTKTVVTADKTTITAGDTVNFSVKVTNLDGSTVPTGTVTLTSPSGGTLVPLFPNAELDVNPANGGVGVISDQIEVPGTYQIVPQFQGDQYQPSTAQTITIVVNPAKATFTTTTTTVIANGGALTVSANTDIVLTATITQTQAIAPPAGDVVTFYRQLSGSYSEALPQQADIVWNVTDGSGPATGTATIDAGTWPRGDYTVTAQFIGDSVDKASSGQTVIGVHSPEPTATTYVGDTTGTTNSPITLSGKLVDDQGMPLSGQMLTLKLNNNPAETCTAGPTTTAGLASCQVTVVDFPGTYGVTASFAGKGDLQPSSGPGTVVIAMPSIIPTTLKYTGDTTGTAGTQETMSFVLSSQFGPLPGELVSVSVDGGAPQVLTTDASGVVSFKAIEPGGTRSLSASFAGDGPYQSSSGPGTLVVSKLPTKLTYDGTTSALPGASAKISFKLTDPTNGNATLVGRTVSITINGTTQTATTGANGDASFPVTLPPGTYPISASYDGTNDPIYNSTTGTGQLVIAKLPTKLTYDGDTSVNGGSPATISFKLTDATSGAALGSRTVKITINNQTYTATSGANGDASFPVTLPPGTYPISASYDGTSDPIYDSTNGSGQLVVAKLPTTLTYDGDTLVTGGGAAKISFKLTDANSGAVLTNRTISVTINGQTYTPNTGTTGEASFTVTLPANTYPISASYDGSNDSTYKSTTGSGQVVVKSTPTTTTVLANPSVAYGSPITLNAKLLDMNSNPLPAGETVKLTIGTGPDTCTGTTNATGYVTCVVTSPTSPVGTYTVTAKFAGDGAYLASSGTGSVTITQATTAIVDRVTGNFLLGSNLVLTGTLTAGGNPVANEQLTLGFGTASCTTTIPTDATGTASCVVAGGVPGPTGPTTTTATFAGDANYKSASDSKPALVYDLAPGGGVFVVGDLTATGNVYFWGSQWWKVNQLSAGDAQAVDPGAFKGYAAAPHTPQCGMTWSTDPGNSTPPPGAPLPAYMAIIVTSQNHKAPGRIITGDIVHVVIVKTDPGYAGNPGHDGTGTVVATIC